MEYLKSDISGTDDDIPNPCLVQTPSGVLFSGTVRIILELTYCEKDYNMDYQIHCLETHAYGAVLRAFIAQSEVLSWEKEALITELRKELRVSDVEHREILGKISLDGSIKSLREWRKGTDGLQLSARDTHASDPMVMGQVSRKRLKFTQMPDVSSAKCPSRAQPSPNHLRDGPWNSSTAVFSPQMHVRQPVVHIPQTMLVQTSVKVKGSVGLQTSKDMRSGFGSGKTIPRSDVIEIRVTDKVINEVEKICGGANPDPAQVEKARLILREHEKALMDAISKLNEASDGDYHHDRREEQHHYSNEERTRNAKGFHNVAYKQFDSCRINRVADFTADHAERAGIPRIDHPDDDFD